MTRPAPTTATATTTPRMRFRAFGSFIVDEDCKESADAWKAQSPTPLRVGAVWSSGPRIWDLGFGISLTVEPVARLHHEDVRGVGGECRAQVAQRAELARS